MKILKEIISAVPMSYRVKHGLRLGRGDRQTGLLSQFIRIHIQFRAVAQQVGRHVWDVEIAGSSPAGPTTELSSV